MIRPVEFSPKIDSRTVVALAAKAGKTITIGEADDYLKNHIGELGQILQTVLEDQVFLDYVVPVEVAGN